MLHTNAPVATKLTPSEVIRQARADMTLRDFAEKLGVSYQAVALWEKTGTRPVQTMLEWYYSPDTPQWKAKLAYDWLIAAGLSMYLTPPTDDTEEATPE